MKKKFLLILSVFIIPCFFLAGCGGHKCTFSENWTASPTHHWHACTDSSCKEKTDYEEHVFEEIQQGDETVFKCKCGLPQ